MPMQSPTELALLFDIVVSGGTTTLYTAYSELSAVANRAPMARITPVLSPINVKDPIYFREWSVEPAKREEWKKANKQVLSDLKLTKLSPVGCGIIVAESDDPTLLVGRRRHVAIGNVDAIIYLHRGQLCVADGQRDTEGRHLVGPVIAKGEVQEKIVPFVLLEKISQPAESTRRDTRRENVDWTNTGVMWKALHTSYPERLPPGMENAGSEVPVGAALAAWWAEFLRRTKELDLAWIAENEDELLMKWDLAQPPETCNPPEPLCAAGLAALAEKNIAYIETCMGWVPSRTGVGVWRIMMYNFEKKKIISGAAATQCGQLSKTIGDSVRAGGYPTRLPRPLPKPVEKA